MKNIYSDLISDTSYAVYILRQEAKYLTLLSASIGESFYNAIECLCTTKGRIAVTGTGKNIYIGRKLVSSLIEFGFSSYFISLEDAEYGDVGTIKSDDAVLVFSDSGESFALSVLIRHARQYGIPLVGITRQAESLLGKHASCLILLPEISCRESCDGVIAVTSTPQMALGEVLVASLLRRMGKKVKKRSSLDGKEFYTTVPMVRDVRRVKDEIPMVSAPTPMPEVLNLMTEKGLGLAGVVVKGRLAGVVTDEVLRCRMRGRKKPGEIARDVMRPVPVTVEETTSVAMALHIMQEKKVYTLFVTREERPVGIVNIYDCLGAEGGGNHAK